MARKEKVYDIEKILFLYQKYGSLNAVRMRTGYGSQKIKEILIGRGIELKKYIPERWDFKDKIKY
ncbi:hypothetical protein [Clostridium folliculivorans]|uniref:Uncharacterized protein n=1 Tax=Clostridium folliculivorans TaxID=2886038 RepID=A0A9W6D9U1_9CLOT|nr:hypothetical protein [Clostridium folliculivorans]GKU24494.1 hypothetical protein CFOLD11_13200 [Clostridium folliculivorans]GKU30592.1 hypothetical protein CFB3_26990 [Clostridium folliculivorans]